MRMRGDERQDDRGMIRVGRTTGKKGVVQGRGRGKEDGEGSRAATLTVPARASSLQDAASGS